MISDETVSPGRGWSRIVQTGEVLRITDIAGHQGVDFLCYNAGNTAERYHAPNTIKAAQSIFLSKNSVLYSDKAKPLMTIIEDTCGKHDTIGGCCSAPSNKMLYGVANVKGCRENFLQQLAAYDMGWRDVVPNINFFCYVPVCQDGSMLRGVFAKGRSKPGDYIELRAEMPALVVISNCPQVHNPCNDGAPTPIRLTVFNATHAAHA